VRIDGRLLAGSPWLELVVSVEWRQRHELMRLECPLARPAVRWAADTSGGVIERPARALTARERQRWEVPVVSWVAGVATAEDGGAGLAVLLDGPQGVSVTPERLGISLLRSPTWPDPGADNGWQRLRLALMPVTGGWRQAEVPRQAQRLREPLWVRPAPRGERRSLPPAGDRHVWPAFPALEDDLRLVAMGPAADGAPDVVIAVQNEGPCRRRLRLADAWRLVRRESGLGDAHDGRGGWTPPGTADGMDLAPWELGFWRLRHPGGTPPPAGEAGAEFRSAR
jgi:alpha-mannosidase